MPYIPPGEYNPDDGCDYPYDDLDRSESAAQFFDDKDKGIDWPSIEEQEDYWTKHKGAK